MEFDKPVLEYIEDGDRVFYMHLYVDWRDAYIRADVDLDDFIEIDGKKVYDRPVTYDGYLEEIMEANK